MLQKETEYCDEIKKATKEGKNQIKSEFPIEMRRKEEQENQII